jgi:hypothetical protein
MEIIVKVSKNNACEFSNEFKNIEYINIDNVKKSISSIIHNFKSNTIDFTLLNISSDIFSEICYHIFNECSNCNILPFIYYQINDLKYIDLQAVYKYDFMLKKVIIKNNSLNNMRTYDLNFFPSIKIKTIFNLVLDKILLSNMANISEDLIQWKENNFEMDLKLDLDKYGIDYTNYHLYILSNKLDLVRQYFIDKSYIPLNYRIGCLNDKNKEYCTICNLKNLLIDEKGDVINCGNGKNIFNTKYLGGFVMCKYVHINDEFDEYKIKYGRYILNKYRYLFSWKKRL